MAIYMMSIKIHDHKVGNGKVGLVFKTIIKINVNVFFIIMLNDSTLGKRTIIIKAGQCFNIRSLLFEIEISSYCICSCIHSSLKEMSKTLFSQNY